MTANLSPEGIELLRYIQRRMGMKYLQLAVGLSDEEIQLTLDGKVLPLAKMKKLVEWIRERTRD